MLALYDICAGDSHRLIIVKEISACECNLHKGNSKYADTFYNCTYAQADLSLNGGLRSGAHCRKHVRIQRGGQGKITKI